MVHSSCITWLKDNPGARGAAFDVAQCVTTSVTHDVLHEQVAWQDTLVPWQTLQDATQVVRQFLCTAIPDLQLNVVDVLAAEDQHALVYYSAAGTHTGILHRILDPIIQQTASSSMTADSCDGQHPMQVPATGKHVSWTGSFVVRLRQTGTASGKYAGWQATAVWHAWDPLFLYEQIGLAPASLPAAPAAAPAAPAAASFEASQASGPADEAEAQACKATVRQYFQVYNSGDFSKLGDIVDPSYHYWGLIDLGSKHGVAAMQAMMSGWRDTLSDFNISNDWLLWAEGNRVIFKWVLQGMHTKRPLRGVAADPSHPKAIKSWGITALSIRPEGQDAEGKQHYKIWRKVSHANGAELLRQLGVLNSSVAAPAAEAAC